MTKKKAINFKKSSFEDVRKRLEEIVHEVDVMETLDGKMAS
jgi:exonuclease VII small subunit